MDEMSADEQLGLPIRQFTNGMRLPYFFKECLSHLPVTEQPFAPEGKVFSNSTGSPAKRRCKRRPKPLPAEIEPAKHAKRREKIKRLTQRSRRKYQSCPQPIGSQFYSAISVTSVRVNFPQPSLTQEARNCNFGILV